MRMYVVLVVLGTALGACGDDDDTARAPDAATGRRNVARDGGARPAADSGAADAGRVDLAEVRAVITDYVAEYDRQMGALCACFAEMDLYPSQEDCTKLLGSGAEWVECATMALANRNNAEEVADAYCLIEQAKKRSDCLESMACGVELLSGCQPDPTACSMLDTDLVQLLLQECPGLGLLERVDAGTD